MTGGAPELEDVAGASRTIREYPFGESRSYVCYPSLTGSLQPFNMRGRIILYSACGPGGETLHLVRTAILSTFPDTQPGGCTFLFSQPLGFSLSLALHAGCLPTATDQPRAQSGNQAGHPWMESRPSLVPTIV